MPPAKALPQKFDIKGRTKGERPINGMGQTDPCKPENNKRAKADQPQKTQPPAHGWSWRRLHFDMHRLDDSTANTNPASKEKAR